MIETRVSASSGYLWGAEAVAKDGVMIMRVNPEVKERIEEAARLSGLSVTSFVIGAAMKAAEQAIKKGQQPAKFGGVPSFFRALCSEASRGGSMGYARAGYELARHADNLAPDVSEMSEWLPEVEKLNSLCESDDRAGIYAWFVQHYPRCMELVPSRRREQFVDGVLSAAEDGRIGENWGGGRA